MPGLDGSLKKVQPAPNNTLSVIPKELHGFSLTFLTPKA